MLIGSGGILRSKWVTGFVWLLAGTIMIVPPILNDGDKTFIAIGVMFLTFGVASLALGRK